jgi:SpoIIAA-like
MIELKEQAAGNILDVTVTGRLTKDDYEHFVPEVERLIHEHGKVRVLFDMHGFHGWTPGALWEDIKFEARHFRDIERLAFVGERKWEAGMASFCKPFTSATIRYFDRGEVDEARQWVRG